ncbi:MFS transporter [Aestuariivivens sediminis]|uniref:MFS transporter n=1 Tax=Aestuariivivens sediminis TaxID=2913557 RepID=UPI001F5AD691|nr:MFS transporter [Aestuariivivens sediminis]
MGSLKLILSQPRYFSVAWVFCSLNIMIGTWVLYIPHVKQKLNLNDTQIGFALFCMALGILVFLPMVPLITRKIGLGKYTVIGIVLFAMAFIGPLLAINYTFLCITLFIVGMFSGSTDVAMNALVSHIEKEDDNNFMSSAHGFFSLGGTIGAVLGTFIMVFFSKPVYHMILMACLVIAVNIWLSKYYYKISEFRTTSKLNKSTGIKILKPLLLIAFLAFVIMSSEGAIEHWSALYLLEVVQISKENLAGLGFVLFSATMTIGRFFGDGISEKIGSIKTILLGCLLACIGYLFILYKGLIVSVIGFGIIGVGLSVIIPELFRIAGKTKDVSPSAGISFVSGIGFIGFLLGPIVLGFISDAFSLEVSFLTLLGLTLFALFASFLKLRFDKLNII